MGPLIRPPSVFTYMELVYLSISLWCGTEVGRRCDNTLERAEIIYNILLTTNIEKRTKNTITPEEGISYQ